MRHAMPLRWIEEAEARQVITTALFEGSPTAHRSETGSEAAARLLARLGAWLALRNPMGSLLPQLQPALIHRPTGYGQARTREDTGYSCDW